MSTNWGKGSKKRMLLEPNGEAIAKRGLVEQPYIASKISMQKAQQSRWWKWFGGVAAQADLLTWSSQGRAIRRSGSM